MYSETNLVIQTLNAFSTLPTMSLVWCQQQAQQDVDDDVWLLVNYCFVLYTILGLSWIRNIA